MHGITLYSSLWPAIIHKAPLLSLGSDAADHSPCCNWYDAMKPSLLMRCIQCQNQASAADPHTWSPNEEDKSVSSIRHDLLDHGGVNQAHRCLTLTELSVSM
jgi:hypothetical protein